ncbi:hypothetical protein GCM10020255_036860 [Rhodococcus baikonurensis]
MCFTEQQSLPDGQDMNPPIPQRPEYLLNDDQLTSRVVDLLIALEEMDADAVRALVDPDIEWRNTGLPSVKGRKSVERALTIVSRLITRYEVVEVLTMSTDHDTVSSRRREIIRIGWFAMHLDVDGHYTFANGGCAFGTTASPTADCSADCDSAHPPAPEDREGRYPPAWVRYFIRSTFRGNRMAMGTFPAR